MNKLENTPANKLRFRALYFGQKVFRLNSWEHPYSTNLGTGYIHESEGYLLLTDLADITDEDAIEVAKKAGYKTDDKDILLKLAKAILAKIDNLHQPVYQYLQSHGYALPFMNLTVADLIEYGWLKIKNHGKH